jgi:hypothetical protein
MKLWTVRYLQRTIDITEIKLSAQQHFISKELLQSMNLRIVQANCNRASTNLNMEGFHGANNCYKNCNKFNFTIEEDVERSRRMSSGQGGRREVDWIDDDVHQDQSTLHVDRWARSSAPIAAAHWEAGCDLSWGERQRLGVAGGAAGWAGISGGVIPWLRRSILITGCSSSTRFLDTYTMASLDGTKLAN